MSDLLYSKDLLRWAADAHAAGRLTAPRATGEAHNPVCGDKVIFDLKLDGGKIVEVGHESKACVLTQASASILGKSLKGAKREDVERLRDVLNAMLASGGGEPSAPYSDFRAFTGAVSYTSRHRCVLLPLDAVLAAFDASDTC